MDYLNQDDFYNYLIKNNKQELKYNDSINYQDYKKQVKDKLIELLGIKNIEKNKCEVKIFIEYIKEIDNFIKTRFYCETEKNCFVPCYFLYPKNKKEEKLPLLIALQGHTSGMHISLGEKHEGDLDRWLISHDFGIQGINNGYAVLLVEQRGMGEQMAQIPERKWNNSAKCITFGQFSLLMGRTLIGQRVWDVKRILDVLPSNFKDVNYSDITITGCSGGGTASYYIGCLDERITLTAPSCGICTFTHSILNTYHCLCNYIPSMYNYFDQPDIACLISPRKFLYLACENDPIFKVEGVKLAAQTISKYYELDNATNHFKLFITPNMGHDWDKVNNFNEIRKMRETK